jgi:hypothetical protein
MHNLVSAVNNINHLPGASVAVIHDKPQQPITELREIHAKHQACGLILGSIDPTLVGDMIPQKGGSKKHATL